MKKISVLFACMLMSVCCPAMQAQTRQDFNLKRAAETSAIKHETVKSSIFGREVLSVQTEDKNSVLNLPVEESMDWEKANYLVAEVYQSNEFTTLLDIRFFRKGESKEHPWIKCYITVLPKLKTQVIFPLSYLDAQELYLPRFPRQLKGVCTGSRLDPEDIESVDIDVYPHSSPMFTAKMEIASVYITDKLPENYDAPAQKYVDEFGQWTGRDWPGKIHNEAELKQKIVTAEKAVAKAGFPKGWSKYGGLKALKFEATGFFRVQHDGKRWWFVDPEGYAFLSSGICCITPSQSGVVQDMEDLLAWIPDRDGPFASVIEENGKKRIDYFKANLMRAYGDKWLEKWEETTPRQLKAWRFNTVANWSDRNIQEKSGLPYLAHMHGLPPMKTMLYRDFHDVFSPEFREVCRQYASQLIPGKDNPCIIGYFLGNEPHWAFGNNDIAYEMFATVQPSYTKLRFIERMKEKYPDVAAFNSAWQLSLRSIDELSMQTFKHYPSRFAERDFREFTVEMIEEWVRVQCEETRKADPNHLNLGTRYAFISSETMMKVGRYFDVFSLNAYTAPYPPATKELSEISGKPVLITEWHFGCGTDGGLPTPGLNTTVSQKDRAAAYRVFAENGFARPEIIGFHWFQWTDQNILGRGDGENFNIGFLDACSLPYPELTEAARKTHESMYDIARGKKEPYEYKFPPVPALPVITE
ncbi:MAG: beta-galactosidase [Tannerellaceae bacterium]|nr:beta-galactosidase [Tannerellaceae bacterium]